MPYLPEDDYFWLTWLLLFCEAVALWLPSRALPADYSTGVLSCSTEGMVAMRPWALVSGVVGDCCC